MLLCVFQDLKPGNLAVSEDCDLKVSTFKLSILAFVSVLKSKKKLIKCSKGMHNTCFNTCNFPQILDFGLARQTESEMTGYVVTRWYRAPEIIFNWMHYSQTGNNITPVILNTTFQTVYFVNKILLLLVLQWTFGQPLAFWLKWSLVRCFSQDMTVSTF